MIFLVGPHPAPVHGLALVNAALRRHIEARGAACAVIDVAARSLERGWGARLSRLPRVLAGLWRLACAARPGDCLYMSLSGGTGQLYEAAFAALARRAGMRCFLHHHSYAYLSRPGWITRALIRLAGPEARHICLSAGMAACLRERYPGVRKCRVVSNVGWLAKPEAAQRIACKRALRTVGFLGNISAEKGIFDVLELAQALASRCPGIAVKLAGPFQDAATERAVRARLGTLGAAAYAGPAYGQDKAAFFREIDVLVFPTRYANEAEPLAVHEAMMHGVPVIAYARGAIGELLGAGGGIAIDPAEPFTARALPQILEWLARPEKLAGASAAALELSAARRRSAARDAATLLDEVCGEAQRVLQDLRSFRLPRDFRGRPAWLVQLWWLTQATLFRWSPQPLYGWRRWLLRRFGASIGAGVRVRPTARVTYPWKLAVGNDSWIGDDVVLYSLGPITIGADCVVSQRCYLCTGSHDHGSASFDIFASRIEVKDQCWLAADVFVAPGITVGRGAVVGARSSVFSDVPPQIVCFGTPARRIGRRGTYPPALGRGASQTRAQ